MNGNKQSIEPATKQLEYYTPEQSEPSPLPAYSPCHLRKEQKNSIFFFSRMGNHHVEAASSSSSSSLCADESMGTFSTVPYEIWMHVCRFVPISAIASLSCLNSHWHTLLTDEQLWRQSFSDRFLYVDYPHRCSEMTLVQSRLECQELVERGWRWTEASDAFVVGGQCARALKMDLKRYAGDQVYHIAVTSRGVGKSARRPDSGRPVVCRVRAKRLGWNATIGVVPGSWSLDVSEWPVERNAVQLYKDATLAVVPGARVDNSGRVREPLRDGDVIEMQLWIRATPTTHTLEYFVNGSFLVRVVDIDADADAYFFHVRSNYSPNVDPRVCQSKFELL
jgi:F-box-like